jgi:hypothetical protein
MLRGYLGRSEAFDEALCRFARAYADQNEQDFALFQKAVRDGRLQASQE